MRAAIGIAVALAISALAEGTTVGAANNAAATRDWTKSVTPTKQGGFRMGNPAATVRLVEYGSLACPHCRHFEQTGYKPLVDKYVRTGRVSYEFRNFLLNGPDIAISLLTRCAGPPKFFEMSEYVYATQPQWQKSLEAMSDADKAQLETMTDQQRIVRFADVGRFAQIAQRFGMTADRSRQCLSDSQGLERLLNITRAAQNAGINRTPTFLINDKVTQAATWEELEPALKAALGGRG
jgi:protein-disulfide isomerase